MSRIVHIGEGPFATAIAVRAQPDTSDVRLAATICGLTHTVTLSLKEARALANAIHAECTQVECARVELAASRGLG